MAWEIIFSAAAEKALGKLSVQEARRILAFLDQRVRPLEDPRAIGEALRGTLAGFWKYRVGDYRIIAHIEDGKLRILVLTIGNRREVYKRGVNLTP
ncbi:type II toxin-antitoxin system RelE family toxin [Niveispirillum irakense]|uniref:type II toxin-antitoxin system RelE family toxin n=1 Tax=Niveispirillum irakense TaxID=34011 RepID=UPI000425B83F|nr:type II toxin-antitoxin system RelE/ParE family toxin [Niveispirillum irakense]